MRVIEWNAFIVPWLIYTKHNLKYDGDEYIHMLQYQWPEIIN